MNIAKESKMTMLMNTITALYLLYAMPQSILTNFSAGVLKIISVICVDLCAIYILLYSTYKFIKKIKTQP